MKIKCDNLNELGAVLGSLKAQEFQVEGWVHEALNDHLQKGGYVVVTSGRERHASICAGTAGLPRWGSVIPASEYIARFGAGDLNTVYAVYQEKEHRHYFHGNDAGDAKGWTEYSELPRFFALNEAEAEAAAALRGGRVEAANAKEWNLFVYCNEEGFQKLLGRVPEPAVEAELDRLAQEVSDERSVVPWSEIRIERTASNGRCVTKIGPTSGCLKGINRRYYLLAKPSTEVVRRHRQGECFYE